MAAEIVPAAVPIVGLAAVPLLAHRAGEAPASFRGDAALFRLDPPITAGGDVIEFVIVSAVDLPDVGYLFPDYRKSETMAFPATESGVVRDWGEIGFVPTKDHAACLADMGYTLVDEEAEHEAAVQRSLAAHEVSLLDDED